MFVNEEVIGYHFTLVLLSSVLFSKEYYFILSLYHRIPEGTDFGDGSNEREIRPTTPVSIGRQASYVVTCRHSDEAAGSQRAPEWLTLNKRIASSTGYLLP